MTNDGLRGILRNITKKTKNPNEIDLEMSKIMLY